MGYDNNVLYDNKVFRDTIALVIDDIQTGKQLVNGCRLIIQESNVRLWSKAVTQKSGKCRIADFRA